MLLRLLEKCSWMTDYREYKVDNSESIYGFEGMYKSIFFMLHTIIVVLLSSLVGFLMTISDLYYFSSEINFIEQFLSYSVYILIMMFIFTNGIMVLGEIIIGIRKRIL